MKTAILAPSMMCLDLSRVTETLTAFQNAGVGYLHMDIMDGDFVPNYAIGTDFCREMRRLSDIPLDIHLMIQRPDLKLDRFDIQKDEIVSVHYESTPHVPRVLDAIRKKGAHPFVALNPATPLSVLDYLIDDLEGVMLMTVNPGYAGQAMCTSALRKIAETRAYLDAHDRSDADLEVDGNVSFVHAAEMREAGANIFVAGSSGVFFKEAPIEENLAKMNTIIGK